MSCTGETFVLEHTMDAFEGTQHVTTRTWSTTIAREGV
jgi:hypothetical protein